jgi:hypothetical protein
VALNPLTPAPEATERRGRAVELQFVIERFEAGLVQLRQKHEQAIERVEQERRAAVHAAIVERRDALAGRFKEVWRTHAEPLAAFLREIAAVDEEVAAANRTKLGAWLDKVETVARPGVGDIDSHKLVGLHTRIPPWDHSAHRMGEMLWPPPQPKLDMVALVPAPLRQLAEARAKEAKASAAARAEIEESNRSHPQRRRVLAG